MRTGNFWWESDIAKTLETSSGSHPDLRSARGSCSECQLLDVASRRVPWWSQGQGICLRLLRRGVRASGRAQDVPIGLAQRSFRAVARRVEGRAKRVAEENSFAESAWKPA